MGKYTDDEIRAMPKITAKIAADYLGISPMMVTLGMRNDVLPIGFAVKKEDRYSVSWSYNIIAERLIAYNHGKINEVQIQNIEKSLDTIISQFEEMKRDLVFTVKRKRGIGGIKQFLTIITDSEQSKQWQLQRKDKKEFDSESQLIEKRIPKSDSKKVQENMLFTKVELTRKELYEEIWKISAAGVAKKYGIPYAKCLAQIREAKIPIPPSGYWTKISYGKPVEQTPLQGNGDKVVTLSVEEFRQYHIPEAVEHEEPSFPIPPGGKETKLGLQPTTSHQGDSKENAVLLAFLTEDERQVVLNVAAQILMPQEHARMQPEIQSYRKRIAEWDKRKRQQEREFGTNWNRGRKEIPPPFAEGISAEQRMHVLRLINALSKAMKPLGWNLTSDLQFAMGQETVTLTFSEATDRVPHTPTKEENLALLKYEEERKKYSWASKPQIRKYDAVYNGRLSVLINGTRTFRDCRSYVLEDCLGDMMLVIYKEVERLKQVRLAKEEAERQRQEQERKQEEFRKRYNTEVDRTRALVNCAADYEIACRIRRYVSAMEERAQPDQALSEWVSWALSKADWYDPTVAKEDELLGKREHELEQGKKELKHRGYWM